MTSKQLCLDVKVETKNGKLSGRILINRLSHHCLADIFKYLTAQDRLEMEKVCEKWREASQLAWYDIKKFPLCKNQAVAEKLLTRCGIYLTSLILNLKCDSSIVPIISKHCHQLTELELKFNKINENHFTNAFTIMTNLKSLYFYYEKLINQPPAAEINGDKLLESLPDCIEKLIVKSNYQNQIHFSYNFASTFERFKNLWFLELKKCIVEFSVIEVITQNKKLSHLSLRKSEVQEGLVLISNMENLEYLDIRRTSNRTTDDPIFNIVNKCKNLRHLDISEIEFISQRGIEQIGNLNNLEEIMMNDLVNVEIDDNVISKFKNLTIFECRTSRVSDNGIIKIIKNSPNLERLVIPKTKITLKSVRCAYRVSKRRQKLLEFHVNSHVLHKSHKVYYEKQCNNFLNIVAYVGGSRCQFIYEYVGSSDYLDDSSHDLDETSDDYDEESSEFYYDDSDEYDDESDYADSD